MRCEALRACVLRKPDWRAGRLAATRPAVARQRAMRCSSHRGDLQPRVTGPQRSIAVAAAQDFWCGARTAAVAAAATVSRRHASHASCSGSVRLLSLVVAATCRAGARTAAAAAGRDSTGQHPAAAGAALPRADRHAASAAAAVMAAKLPVARACACGTSPRHHMTHPPARPASQPPDSQPASPHSCSRCSQYAPAAHGSTHHRTTGVALAPPAPHPLPLSS